jgi:aconitate hydratase
MFEHEYAHAFDGDQNGRSLPIPEGGIYQWDDKSTYIKKPPYFDNIVDPGAPLQDFTQFQPGEKRGCLTWGTGATGSVSR